jgi:proteic killer suppression protein
MELIFEKKELEELFILGEKIRGKYGFQTGILSTYQRVIEIMKNSDKISDIRKINSLNYEKLKGDKKD